MLGMRFLSKLDRSGSAAHKPEEPGASSEMRGVDDACAEESNFLKTIGWVSAALGAVALGLLVGRELRERYKFNRRTPYDLYSHSGDELPDVDCGVGI
jgi:hypothetical protein